MISDLTIGETSNTLEEYYTRVYKLQAEAHKSDYMLVHNEIKEKLQGASSYTELGVNQGATLAVALLNNIRKIHAYDISLTPYNKAKHLFNNYTKANDIDYHIYESDTLLCNIDTVDVLYIDTMHTYEHLTKELKLHGSKVNKYIIFHDTFAQEGLKRAVNEYVNNNKEWSIITDCKKSVGFMTIKRR